MTEEYVILTITDKYGSVKTMLIHKGTWTDEGEKPDNFLRPGDEFIKQGIVQIMGDSDMLDETYISD